MKLKFPSFFDYQKRVLFKAESNVKNKKHFDLPTIIPYNSIIVDTLITNVLVKSHRFRTNFYSDLIQFMGNDKKIVCKGQVDAFALAFAIQLGFKVITGLITNPKTISGQGYAFFRYYSKLFSYKVVRMNSELFPTNKYTRIDYQRKLQIRRRNDFMITKSKGYISFFSAIFKKNNLKKTAIGVIKARKKQHARTPVNKLKLRSIKDAAFKSIHPTGISFGRTIFIKKKLNRVTIKGIFPWKVNYRSTKRVKKTFKAKRKRKNERVVNSVSSKLYKKTTRFLGSSI